MRIGLYNLHWRTLGGGERYASVMARVLSSRGQVELIGADPMDVQEVGDHLGVDLSGVGYRQLSARGNAAVSELSAEYDLFVNSSFHANFLCRAPRSAYVVFYPQIIGRPIPPGIASGLLSLVGSAEPTAVSPDRSVRGRLRTRLQRRIEGSQRDFLDSYDLFLAISEFTRAGITQRWDRPSEILAPPVDVESFRRPAGVEKRPIILAVGRFFAGSHNKKHLEMLEVFRDMCDQGRIPDGWELHLVGNVHRRRMEDLDYIADVHRLAEGYPVHVLKDLDFEELKDEYHRASIFWHATGLDEDESKRPEKHEHFGITTCEAMSAGCVPVGHRQGGPARDRRRRSERVLLRITNRAGRQDRRAHRSVRVGGSRPDARAGGRGRASIRSRGVRTTPVRGLRAPRTAGLNGPSRPRALPRARRPTRRCPTRPPPPNRRRAAWVVPG